MLSQFQYFNRIQSNSIAGGVTSSSKMQFQSQYIAIPDSKKRYAAIANAVEALSLMMNCGTSLGKPVLKLRLTAIG